MIMMHAVWQAVIDTRQWQMVMMPHADRVGRIDKNQTRTHVIGGMNSIVR
jgi:hypothetical protein